jgi:hypothetical protein
MHRVLQCYWRYAHGKHTTTALKAETDNANGNEWQRRDEPEAADDAED